MGFREAVQATATLSDYYRRGLQGIRRVDRRRLSSSKPRRLQGTVDLEKALPSQARWDYCIGVARNRGACQAIWLEVHPAFHRDEVFRKLAWLQAWLPAGAPALFQLPRCFVWLASGRVPFRSGSPQMKQIEQKGLLFRAGRLDLDGLS